MVLHPGGWRLRSGAAEMGAAAMGTPLSPGFYVGGVARGVFIEDTNLKQLNGPASGRVAFAIWGGRDGRSGYGNSSFSGILCRRSCSWSVHRGHQPEAVEWSCIRKGVV